MPDKKRDGRLFIASHKKIIPEDQRLFFSAETKSVKEKTDDQYSDRNHQPGYTSFEE